VEREGSSPKDEKSIGGRKIYAEEEYNYCGFFLV
jgi:hypothetical protein